MTYEELRERLTADVGVERATAATAEEVAEPEAVLGIRFPTAFDRFPRGSAR
jgi:hypothetical protein